MNIIVKNITSFATILLLLLSPLAPTKAQTSPAPFITEWTMDAGSDFTINIEGYYVYVWTNVTTSTMVSQGQRNGNLTLSRPESATYRLTITQNVTPLIHSFKMSNATMAQFLVKVVQWGAIRWSTMNSMFANATNLTSIPSGTAPNLSSVEDMSSMFKNATSFNKSLNHWDVSNVTNMSNMFNGATNFNQPLDNWNVTKVTNMNSMFQNASSFNQDLGNWSFNSNTPPTMTNAFNNNGLDCDHYSQTLIGWSQNNTANNLSINIPVGYLDSPDVVAARSYLTQTLNWTISDLGTDANCLVSLPIHLGSFKAIAHQSQVNLEWNTFAEMNNKGFEVQRSADGRNWENMTWMISQAENGNSSALLSYYFTDYTPLKGSNYYRLKQVDVDSKVTYSETRVVNMGSNNVTNYVVYPNPVQHELNISNLIGTEKVEIYNAMGALVLSQQATSKISLNTLPTGMYLVKIIDANGQVHQEKIIKE